MAHWAKIDENNIVENVVVTKNSDDDEGAYFVNNVLGGTWVKTSINTIGGVHYSDVLDDDGNRTTSLDQSKSLRFNYAGIGFTYDSARDAFIPPTPYPSWVLDEGTCQWVAPIAMPEGAHTWDEEAGDWVEVVDPY
jgi:hypothetical protein